MGINHLGRCVFSRMLYGIRPTILLIVGIISLGALIGVILGYFRRWIDEIMMRICDVMLTFSF